MRPIIFLAFANDRIDDARYLRNLPLELRQIRSVLENISNKDQFEMGVIQFFAFSKKG